MPIVGEGHRIHNMAYIVHQSLRSSAQILPRPVWNSSKSSVCIVNKIEGLLHVEFFRIA